jgi:hypothetical protein
MTTTTTAATALSPFLAPASLMAMLETERATPQRRDERWAFHDAIERHARELGLDEERARVAMFLDDAQVQSLISGEEFAIGRVAIKACNYNQATGDVIHLRASLQCARELNLVNDFRIEGDSFYSQYLQETMCMKNYRELLNDFDATSFSYFSTMQRSQGFWMQRPEPLDADGMVGLVCHGCLIRAHRLGTQAGCDHGGINDYCHECTGR